MFTPSRASSGVTLVEVLVSLALIGILVTGIISTVISSQFLTSYAKHKQQAMYVAQRIIEEQRRLAFSTIASQASAAVTLDTKGTYGTTTDDFNGARIITVTSVDAYRKTITVEVNWTEQITSGKVTMREYYTTTLSNEPQVN